MSEHKVLLFILSLIFYCLYSVNMWFTTKNLNEEKPQIPSSITDTTPEAKPNTDRVENVKIKIIPLLYKDACSVLDIFTKKPLFKQKKIVKEKEMEIQNNTITMIGITAFLLILLVNALLDVLKVKEEERARRKLNPDGERRKSLSEFANKRMLRRESSKFGTQLSQIAEVVDTPPEETKGRKDFRPYTRGDSTGSYLTEKPQKSQMDMSAPASIGESAVEIKHVKRSSVAKLIGARPAPMVRRSSFPVLPHNPDVQALMTHKQSSFDSDDESEGKKRRVRMIRRF